MAEKESSTWPHFCLVEQSSMEIGDGEACNWCGVTIADECSDDLHPAPNESEFTLHRRISK